MSIYLELSDLEDQWQLLTPCSSCNTLVGAESSDASFSRSDPQPTQITIILPNLIDRITISIDDVKEFVADRLSSSPDVTVTHLLIYLFLRNQDSSISCINNFKLLHTGRQYAVQRQADLVKPLPLLTDIIARFPTFQLFISRYLTSSPIRLSIDALLTMTAENDYKAPLSPPVTYAESMIRMFKNTRRRRSSITSTESRMSSRPTRTRLNDSSTDVDENNLGQTKAKFGRPWKRVFRRHSVAN